MSFPLYLDENVPTDLAEALRQRGFDATTALEAGLAHKGISDEDQLRFASQNERAILTFNARDFAPMAVRWATSGQYHAGVMLSPERTVAEMLPEVLRAFQDHPEGISNMTIWLYG